VHGYFYVLKMLANWLTDWLQPVTLAGYVYYSDAAIIRIGVVFRLQVSGVNVSYINCDGSPHSYVALFTNYAERPAFSYTGPYAVDVCDTDTNAAPNPSGRVMPVEYFTFMEWRAGGCGHYMQTFMTTTTTTTTAAIGFR